jgi:hypothetical protein
MNDLMNGETRRALLAGGLLAATAVSIAGSARAAAPVSGPPGAPPAPPAGLNDFDFFMGEWTTRHHRLVGRLKGSTTWQDFDGRLRAQHILGGQGNLDDGVINIPSGSYRGATVRFFDPEQKTWSIFWLDSRMVTVDTPMVGGFAGKHGLFYGDDVLDGHPIKVRFLWEDEDPRRCRWEQAFWDAKAGAWETNWVMHHTRVA